MAEQENTNLWALSDLEIPWCLRVVATMRIADHIAAGLTSAVELASATACDAEALTRVLRRLTEAGIFSELEMGRFALNDTAQQLRESHPAGLRFILDQQGIGSRFDGAWPTLLKAVRTGKTAYADIYGASYWDDLASHSDLAAGFDALMGPAGHASPDPDIPLSSGWAHVRTVVDVGGGTGSLLGEVLRVQAQAHGVLVDLPSTVARARPILQAAGVAGRVELVGQSFFAPLPAGADVYLLKSILADWPDAEAETILRRCAEAARPTGCVLLLNGVSPGERPAPELLMLVLVGGKDRTLNEFRDLAAKVGLSVTATTLQASGRYVVECRPV
jgi:hypothetical protein